MIYLNRLMPLEGGLYQWAKFSFNPLIGFMVAWNLWMLGITVMALGGLVVTTNVSYALGPTGSWIQESKGIVAAVSTVLTVALAAVAVRGLSLGKWVHNAGGIIMITTYSVSYFCRFSASGAANSRNIIPSPSPCRACRFISINIFTKLAVGALSGFEYVAILAGECRAPAKSHRQIRARGGANYRSHVYFRDKFCSRFHQRRPNRSHRTRAASLQPGISWMARSQCDRLRSHHSAGRTRGCPHKHLSRGQLSITHGCRMGSICFPSLVQQVAQTFSNAG